MSSPAASRSRHGLFFQRSVKLHKKAAQYFGGILVIAKSYGVQDEADNGREALEMAIKSQPDAVGLRSYTFGALTVSSARAHSA
jgi:hypothetical protein